MLAVVDWTPIIAAAVAGVPGCLAAFVSILNRREIRTPSGNSLGELAEKTHDLSAASVGLGEATVKLLNGRGKHEGEPTPHD